MNVQWISRAEAEERFPSPADIPDECEIFDGVLDWTPEQIAQMNAKAKANDFPTQTGEASVTMQSDEVAECVAIAVDPYKSAALNISVTAQMLSAAREIETRFVGDRNRATPFTAIYQAMVTLDPYMQDHIRHLPAGSSMINCLCDEVRGLKSERDAALARAEAAEKLVAEKERTIVHLMEWNDRHIAENTRLRERDASFHRAKGRNP